MDVCRLICELLLSSSILLSTSKIPPTYHYDKTCFDYRKHQRCNFKRCSVVCWLLNGDHDHFRSTITSTGLDDDYCDNDYVDK